MRSVSAGRDRRRRRLRSRWPSTRTNGGEPTLMCRSEPRCSTVYRSSSFRSSMGLVIGARRPRLSAQRETDHSPTCAAWSSARTAQASPRNLGGDVSVTSTTTLMESGRERLRVGPWRGDPDVADPDPVPGSPLPSAEFVRRCLRTLATQGYGRVVTGALSPSEQSARSGPTASWSPNTSTCCPTTSASCPPPNPPTGSSGAAAAATGPACRARPPRLRPVLAPRRRRPRRGDRGHAPHPVPGRHR